MKKMKALALCVACLLCLTGCWDKIEIDNRAFILVMGIDKASEEETALGNLYKITLVNPDTTKSEEGKVMEFFTFDTVASSYSIGTVQLLQRFPKNHSYEHTKAVIFGQELMKDPNLLKNVLDIFTRGHQFNKSMLVFMAEDEASKAFEIKPKFKVLLAYYITGIADNNMYATRIGRVSFLDFIKQMKDNDGDGVMPHLIATADEYKIEHIDLFRDYKHIGHLNEKETIAYKWLNDIAEGGVIEFVEEDHPVPFTHFTFKTKISMDKIEEDKIYLAYDMETEGAVEEYSMGKKLYDEEKLKELETKLEKLIENDSMDLVKKMQQEYKVDLLGVRNYLSKYHPSIYKSIEKDFDEYFESNIVIEVKADVKIRRIGKSK